MSQDGLLNPPKQARSKDTLERILTAARDLLRDRDFKDVSVDDVVARAGSSKGSFYQRFPDKRSLLVYLLRAEHEAAVDSWSAFLEPARWVEPSLDAVLDAFLARLMTIYREDENVMRAYAGEVFDGDGEIRELSDRLTRHVFEGLRHIVRRKTREVGHTDPDRATAFLITVLITLLPPLFLSPTQRSLPEPMSHDELEREVRYMIRAYIGVVTPTLDEGP